MTNASQHQALLKPGSYPHPTALVEFRETHVSRLYITDEYVYKLKKPVDFGFLNFTSLEKRRHFCHEEVRLNERCCPDTYLDVVAIHQDDGRFSIDGSGPVVDYAVKMKRLPAERMLDRLIDNDDPQLPQEIERLATQLAIFHQTLPPIRTKHSGYRATMRFNWHENLTQTKPYIGSTLSAAGFMHLHDWLRDFYWRQRRVFIDRERAGFIREGHGDLHAEHICLTDPIRIYDCIEFNRRFRVIDLADELAFLAMDLDFRGRPDLARLLLATYQNEFDIEMNNELLRFYRVYRAWVRGKVESFLSSDESVLPQTREQACLRSRRYFNLALGDLQKPALILISGLMGVGKTTLAHSLARALRAKLLRSDVIRKELVADSNGSSKSAFGEGIYSRQITELTYQHLLEQARSELTQGRSAIVDASFSRRNDRDAFRVEARRNNVLCHLLYLRCSPELALQRLGQRQAIGNDLSDGRPALYAQQKEAFEPIEKYEEATEIATENEVETLCGESICLMSAKTLLK